MQKKSENAVIYEGILSKGYGISPKMVTTDRNLTIEAKAIYSYISSFAGNGESAFPEVKTILYHLGISENRYYKHFKLLVKYGYIEVQKRRKYDEDLKKWTAASNLYIIKQVIEKKEDCINDSDVANISKNQPKKTKSKTKTNNDRPIDNTISSESINFEGVQNEGIQNEGIQNKGDIINNNSSFNNNFNNVVVNNEEKVIELYKTFKLEKKFTPHAKKLLQLYASKFDLDVFEQVFISASSDTVLKKYAYIKRVFEVLDQKNIKTLEDYLKDQKSFKKQDKTSKSIPNTVKTKYHDTFNEHYKNYTSDELDDKLRQSKSNNNNNLEEQLYLAAVENGFNSLSNLSQSRVLHYATENNLDIPK
ncbi:MAG: helix-turn-helix domain-containing protein [Clostridium sp.]|jgi:hypothetical protein|nr:helix-turn-helix domain-containing protein [Clostridium sp.]DAO12822.1 MAG TPA: helix-turn-helix domain protein [Caudoviricetes sp.]